MDRTSGGFPSLAPRVLAVALAMAAGLAPVPAARAARPQPARFAEQDEAAAARAEHPSGYDALWTGYPLPGVAATIHALVPFGGGIVAGSDGYYFGTTYARRVALWDGMSWHPLGDGVPASTRALSVLGGQLIAAGLGGSSVAGEKPAVFAWDGSSWVTIGSVNGTVYATAELGGDLYVGGQFTSVNGVPALNVARWDGSGWFPVGGGLPAGSTVKALVAHGADLVAGGSLPAYQGVASWNGAGWSPLGAGLQNGASAGTVSSLVSDGVTLYASGTFSSSGGSAVTRVVAWNGSTWTGLAGATQDSHALALYGGAPMATVLDGSVRRPQWWSGTAWQAFNQPRVDPLGYALAGPHLYAAGMTGGALSGGPTPTFLGGFYRFDGAAWSAQQQAWAPDMKGLSGLAYCAQEWQGSLYVGGIFGYFGTGAAYQQSIAIARWDGADWNAMGSSGQHFDLAVWNDSLVAAVDSYVRIWNGSNWRRLSPSQSRSGFDTFVFSLAVHQGALHVFGADVAYGATSAGDVQIRGVGRWNGTHWEPAGTGVDDPYGVYVGASWGSRLVIGGTFMAAGGSPARRIAYWDGSAFHPMGSGVDKAVYSLIEFAGDLVAGGDFTEAGGDSVRGAARFDGVGWHAMGARAQVVRRFRVHGGRLYAAGRFLDDLGQPVDGAALWNGAEWVPLGSGLDASGVANNLEFLRDDLYLVGNFNRANGSPARHFAKLADVGALDVPDAAPHLPRLALAPSPNPSQGGVRLAFVLPAAGHARLVIRDVAGREIARLLDGSRAAGAFTLTWDARVASGLYFATLEAAGERTTTRLVRLR